MRDGLIKELNKDYEGYLRDESRKTGSAQSISFPVSVEDIMEILYHIRLNKHVLTIQGARTGITAGAVPCGGHILNLEKMNGITGIRVGERGDFLLKVQPGLPLAALTKSLYEKSFDTEGWSREDIKALQCFSDSGQWFFPTDPTETSATLGGMTACNASGARSFHYGPVRKYIEALDIMLADGSMLYLKRGLQKADGRSVKLKTGSGSIISGKIPNYTMPDVKNASGYYSKENMDMIDLFIGNEGTLGIVTGIEIRLLPMPKEIWGFMAFFPSEASALRFVRGVRGERINGYNEILEEKPVSIEFFNSGALQLLRRQKASNAAFSIIPAIPESFNTAVYVEYHGKDEDSVCEMVLQASELLSACGGCDESTWVAASAKEMEKMKFFRHAVPESVNLLIDSRRIKNPELKKLGTDMAVPDESLDAVMELYNKNLREAGLEYVIFGHIGNNHVHVNILPKDMDEYHTGKKLYLDWAEKVINMGGTVSAEHGIGKLKTDLLRLMYGEEGVRQMKAVKNLFDPEGILNRGNLFY